MRAKRLLIVALAAGAAILALRIGIGAAVAPASFLLEGRVYEGEVGVEPPPFGDAQPIEGVVVSVYGSLEPYPVLGDFILSATTNISGWYGLDVPESPAYEYYNIVEDDPGPYYSSVGATTVSGTVRSANWIQYDTLERSILDQVLTGNKFWDTGWQVLFEDDFDDGVADGWDLEAGWQAVEVEGRRALSGTSILPGGPISPTWAVPVIEGWVDYELSTTLKLVEGAVHINVRFYQELLNELDQLQTRYYVGLQHNNLYIKKQIGPNFYDLCFQEDIPFPQGEWLPVRVRVEETTIRVFVADALVAECVDDSDDPVMFGGFAFEVPEHSQAYVDAVHVLGPVFAYAPAHVWTRMGGPLGGLGYDIRYQPGNKDVLLVTDNPSGVNKSYDGGQTWTQRNINITTRTGLSKDEIPIFSLALDPSYSQTMWAGTQDAKGIYKTTDAGETWTKLVTGVIEGDEISFRGFGVHPHDTDVVFGGAEIDTVRMGQRFKQTKGVIYKTSNGGQSWAPVLYTDNLVRFILFDYTNPLTMYASTGIFDRESWEDTPTQGVGPGILKSTNGGITWTQINTGIPLTNGNRFVGYLDMHPTEPHVLYAAAGNNTWGNGGIFRTTDAGASWTEVLTDDIFTLVIVSPSSPNVVYAGSARAIWRSDEGGDPGTWHRYDKPGEGHWGSPGVRAGVPIGAAVDPDDPMTIFINNYQGGNFKSTDGGQTWTDASKGYTGVKLTGVAMNRRFPAQVYAVGRSGPFRSDDGGENWSGLAYSPAGFPEYYGVAVNPGNSREVLVTDEFEGVILKSWDGGSTWTKVFDHPDVGLLSGCTSGPKYCNDGFKAIEYAPSDPSVVYAGGCVERRTIDGYYNVIRSSMGMYKSVTGGDSWFAITNTLPMTANLNIHDIAVHPTNTQIVYIGTWKNGLWKTADGGTTWGPMNTGLPSLDVRSVAIDPDDPQVVYAGLGQGKGVYKTKDGGGKWVAANTGLKLVCPSHLLPVGGAAQGVSLEPLSLVTSGSGYTAKAPWTVVRAIVIDPTDSNVIYAADQHTGVYLSINGGATWRPINDGLTMRAITRLDISDDGQVIYAATWGGGVFRLGDIELRRVYLPLVVRNHP